MKKKIAVIADYGSSQSVWNALRSHLELLEQAGYELRLYAPSENDFSFMQEHCKSRMTVYGNRKELLRLLIQAPELCAIYCITVFSVLKIWRIKFARPNCRILFWVQGTLPYESWMRNHSRFRFVVLSLLERLAFRLADRFIFVSGAMASFYEKRIPLAGKKWIAVPCINELPRVDGKIQKIPDSFVYTGGMAVWQCFEDILKLYRNVRTERSVFHIITRDTEAAEKMVERFLPDRSGVRIYPIADRREMAETLARFEYGFLIRKKDPVNEVASPIKFLEYLACNVNVIMTDAVPSYAEIVRKYKVGTVLDDFDVGITLQPYNPSAAEVYASLFDRNLFIQKYRYLLDDAE